MFSRFDNMMQHTHTHSRTKKKEASDSSFEGKSSSPVSVPEDNNNSLMHVSAMDNYHPMYYHSPPSPTSLQEEDYIRHYNEQRYYSPRQCTMMASPQYSVSSYSHHSTFSPPRSPVSSVPPTADYSSSDTRRKQYYSRNNEKRRLSYIELAAPIQQLDSCTEDDDDERQMSPLSIEEDIKIEGVDVTADEYEALQGFSKFCAEPVVRFPIQLPPLRSSSARSILSSNPNLTSYAFRQQIPTFQESFKRAL
jgi:hypothetical protein